MHDILEYTKSKNFKYLVIKAGGGGGGGGRGGGSGSGGGGGGDGGGGVLFGEQIFQKLL